MVDDLPSYNDKLYSEVFLWIILAVSVILFLSNFGIGGVIGKGVASFGFGVIGMCAYLFPVVLLVGSFFAVSNKGNSVAVIKVISVIVLLMCICLGLELFHNGADTIGAAEAYRQSAEEKLGGGFFGGLFAKLLVSGFGLIGAYIIDFSLIVICLILITGKSAFKGVREGSRRATMRTKLAMEEAAVRRKREAEREEEEFKIGRGVTLDTKLTEAPVNVKNPSQDMNEVDIRTINPDAGAVESVERVALRAGDESSVSIFERGEAEPQQVQQIQPVQQPEPERKTARRAKKENIVELKAEPETVEAKPENITTRPEPVTARPEPAAARREPATAVPEAAAKPVSHAPAREIISDDGYKYPTTDLLKAPKANTGKGQGDYLQETAEKLEQTLHNFGVKAKVTDATCGPSVTRYEIQPEPGVKVSKIVNLADDIKLNLAAADIRIEAPIPGKAAVGIEVPNKENTPVTLRELMESPEFKK
ncbi:MAG: DNA translocase FtsK 4TM domain-containing protein, partial [Lachnospiraceae bacterium]|nr:DNA translocase FtsK 4TM domain-containing protein [Lachnospiraceae bacterium]